MGAGMMLAALAWPVPSWAARDTVLSTASSAGPARGEPAHGRAAPDRRGTGVARTVPAPSAALPQGYPPGPQMPVYVGPDGVVAVPTIDMTPGSGVVYAPPPPRSSITDGKPAKGQGR